MQKVLYENLLPEDELLLCLSVLFIPSDLLQFTSAHLKLFRNYSDLDSADILKLKIYRQIVHSCRDFCSIK